MEREEDPALNLAGILWVVPLMARFHGHSPGEAMLGLRLSDVEEILWEVPSNGLTKAHMAYSQHSWHSQDIGNYAQLGFGEAIYD